MGSSYKSHALIFPYPVIGHMNPMMEFAFKLADKGMLVTLLNILSIHHRILSRYPNPKGLQNQEGGGEKDGLELFTSSGLPDNLRLVGLSDGLPLELDREANRAQLRAALWNMGGVLKELLAGLKKRGEPVTCFIADSFMTWTEPVAHAEGIPWVSMWTQSSAVFSIYYHAFHTPEVSASEVLSVTNSLYQDLPPMAIKDLPTFVEVDDDTDNEANQKLLAIFREVFCGLKEKADYILGTSFYQLEPAAQDYMAAAVQIPFDTVGPLLPNWMLRADSNSKSDGHEEDSVALRASIREEESGCLQWLDGQGLNSVLFVSFGSLVPISKEQTEEIAYGLEASGQAFLWVIRGMGDTCHDLPTGFAKRVVGRGLLISWAPQLQVLAHPSVGGFLTHCGWNSTIESVTLGVPMLGLPYISDQPTNCKIMVDHWNIGLPLCKEINENGQNGSEDNTNQFSHQYRIVPGVARREEVEHKVRILMQEEEGREMRRRAKYLSSEANATASDGGTSEKALQAFVLEMEKRATYASS